MGKRGFGKPTVISTRRETKFMHEVLRHIEESSHNPTKIYQFLQSNLDNLNELLLEALPIIFNKLTANELLQKRERVAALFLEFGVWMAQFSLGDRLLNMELSIAAFKLSLKIFTYNDFPKNWASAHANLGCFYRNRVRGNRAENLEQEIEHFKLALLVYTREPFPEAWGMIQNNLGDAYCNRIRGDRAENLELAIKYCKLALQVRIFDDLPREWAATQNNLGNAYLSRIRGDRTENIKQAIEHFQLALQVRTRGDLPQEWAETQNNLGIAYFFQTHDNRVENLERAIEHYNLALQIYNQREFTEEWATTKNNLAEALTHRALLTENSTNLDTAIALLQASLEVEVFGSPNFIDSQYLFGNALTYRYENGQNPDDLKQALEAYKIALDNISLEHYDRKQMWKALPITQVVLGTRLVRDGKWQEGLQLLLNSVTQLSTSDDSLAHANALFQTGLAYETLFDYTNARLYYRDALRLYEYLQDLPGIAKSRTGLGSVLVSQGHLEKGMKELSAARESYHQLHQPQKAAEIDSLYQSAQQVIERRSMEIYA
jgi:tetratricopeptide (TPR) repeat protein